MRMYNVLFCLSLLCCFPSIASETVASGNLLKVQFPVEKFQLKNGLTVLLSEDRSIPMISYQTWYRVGSKNEHKGVTGAAHMLEHMMFKGAKKYSGKEFDSILQRNGVINNAFTTGDYTGFYENLPSSQLELIMDLEVDRMSSLALREQDLLSEKQVVAEERRWRVDNNPMGLLRELLMGTLYKTHPYSWPVIGTATDIQNYKVESLRTFYDNYYGPNNAVLVLVGDFDRGRVRSLIEKNYGVLKERPVPEKVKVSEPDIKSQRRRVVDGDVQNQNLAIGFKTVSAIHKDMYALDLLANILSGSAASRLYKKLVYEKQLALNVYTSHASQEDPGVFFVYVGAKPGLGLEEIERIIFREIRRLAEEPVSEKELERAKNQIMKSTIDGLTTIYGKAQALAFSEIVQGSYDYLFNDPEKYQAVTAADIQHAAKSYLKSESSVVVILKPKDQEL